MLVSFIRYFIIIVLCFIVLTSCKIKRANLHDDLSNIESKESGNHKVALISLNIEKNYGEWVFSVSNSTLFNGKRDDNTPRREQIYDNDVLCIITDYNNSPIDSILIFQPLNPRLEYPLEDGNIGSFVTEIERNEVMLKFSYNKNIKYLIVYLSDAGEMRFMDQFELIFDQ